MSAMAGSSSNLFSVPRGWGATVGLVERLSTYLHTGLGKRTVGGRWTPIIQGFVRLASKGPPELNVVCASEAEISNKSRFFKLERFNTLSLLVVLALISLTDNSFAGDFDGRYRVGRTFCQVSPSKMSYEVRWAKGSGPMYFFFEEAPSASNFVYVSEPKKNGKDRFEFDSDEHNSGRFVRSDGKVFSVKRMQASPSKAAR